MRALILAILILLPTASAQAGDCCKQKQPADAQPVEVETVAVAATSDAAPLTCPCCPDGADPQDCSTCRQCTLHVPVIAAVAADVPMLLTSTMLRNTASHFTPTRSLTPDGDPPRRSHC